jgi:hypothetical protein
MKSLNAKRWEKRRSRGFKHFVFVTGIFSFGLPLTLFMVAIEWWNFQHTGVFERAPAFHSEFGKISLWLVLVGGPNTRDALGLSYMEGERMAPSAPFESRNGKGGRCLTRACSGLASLRYARR